MKPSSVPRRPVSTRLDQLPTTRWLQTVKRTKRPEMLSSALELWPLLSWETRVALAANDALSEANEVRLMELVCAQLPNADGSSHPPWVPMEVLHLLGASPSRVERRVRAAWDRTPKARRQDLMEVRGFPTELAEELLRDALTHGPPARTDPARPHFLRQEYTHWMNGVKRALAKPRLDTTLLTAVLAKTEWQRWTAPEVIVAPGVDRETRRRWLRLLRSRRSAGEGANPTDVLRAVRQRQRGWSGEGVAHTPEWDTGTLCRLAVLIADFSEITDAQHWPAPVLRLMARRAVRAPAPTRRPKDAPLEPHLSDAFIAILSLGMPAAHEAQLLWDRAVAQDPASTMGLLRKALRLAPATAGPLVRAQRQRWLRPMLLHADQGIRLDVMALIEELQRAEERVALTEAARVPRAEPDRRTLGPEAEPEEAEGTGRRSLRGRG